MTIVKDDDVLSGDPRIEGHRVTVYHVLRATEDFSGVDSAARELRIPIEDVIEALRYAKNHPHEIAEIEREYQKLQRNQ